MTQQKIVVQQLENETMQDYVKFLVFVGLGSGRSLSQAYTKYYEYNTNNEVSPAWRNLATKFRWVDRAAEHDTAHSK